jgi:hypothetical protein
MTGNSGTPSSLTIVSWMTLLVLLANMGFVADYSSLGESPTIAEAIAEYGNVIVPTEFAKATCVVLLVAVLLFYIDALWPRRRRVRVYDRLVVPLALTSVLASCWLVAFRQEEIALSVASAACSVALSGVMFARVASVSPGQHSGWLRVPFGLHFAAMSLALLVTLTQWLHASGLLMRTAVMQDDVATSFFAIAAAAGGFVAFRCRDFVYPAVIASCAGATCLAQRSYNPHFAILALIVFVGMFLVAVLAAVALGQQPWDPKHAASRRNAKLARKAQDKGWYLIGTSSSIMRL